MIIFTPTLMLEMQEISENVVFISALTRLIVREDFGAHIAIIVSMYCIP
jgi:hypothetical protein